MKEAGFKNSAAPLKLAPESMLQHLIGGGACVFKTMPLHPSQYWLPAGGAKGSNGGQTHHSQEAQVPRHLINC